MEASADLPWPVLMYDNRTGFTTRSDAELAVAPLPWPEGPGLSYEKAFITQWGEFAKVIRGESTVLATAREAGEVARLMETCYANRQPLPQSWLGLKSTAVSR